MNPFTAFLAVLCLAVAPASAPFTEGVVVGVVDGDTLRVWIDGEVRRVHVAGIDTPNTLRLREPAEYYGPEAAGFSREAALGRRVRLTPDPLLAAYGLEMYVQLPDGKDLGAELAGRGMAFAQRGCLRCKDLRAAERQARGAFTGLWNPETHRAHLLGKNKAVLLGLSPFGSLGTGGEQPEAAKPEKATAKSEKAEKAGKPEKAKAAKGPKPRS
jgi:endonuclease YncB( thermonuclease family)